MNDTLAFAANDYDSEIRRTVPFYDDLYRQITETAKLLGDKPLSWLDIGCGTGKTNQAGHEPVLAVECGVWVFS
ncbi:MAG: hypothetical protein K2J73_04325 [Oscillospiraceae bacterium]|nr:hypothetical protein [Oscillospiraceae bacterium]